MIRKHPTHLPNMARHNTPVLIFVTVCALDRTVNTFATNEMHGMLQEAWNNATSHRVGAYVLMPDHIHLFCAPTSMDSESVAKWVRYWKVLVTKKLGGSRACATVAQRPAPLPESAQKSLFQRDCGDTQLRAGDNYHDKWEYVRNNPVRKGLVILADDWPYWGIKNEFVW